MTPKDRRHTSNRCTPLGDQDGSNCILTVPVVPGSPFKLLTVNSMIASAASTDDDVERNNPIVDTVVATTAFFAHWKISRRFCRVDANNRVEDEEDATTDRRKDC